MQHYCDAKTVITQTAALVREQYNEVKPTKNNRKKLKCGAAMQKPHDFERLLFTIL
jgi:hypothetical protein